MLPASAHQEPEGCPLFGFLECFPVAFPGVSCCAFSYRRDCDLLKWEMGDIFDSDGAWAWRYDLNTAILGFKCLF